MEERGISDSAFLVNESRSRNVPLSRDRFARLWVTEATRRLWEDFAREVYPRDDVELSLRNRFYLDVLEKAVREQPSVVFVNLAAGFSSYPFLIEKPCRSIEADLERVCRFKRSRIEEWCAAGVLPPREIEFVACDLAVEKDIAMLGARLRDAIGSGPSVFFLEGITYYLKRDALLRILGLLGEIQSPGSRLALDFWSPEYRDLPVPTRFRKFFAERFGHGESEYHFFGADLLRSFGGYEIVDLADIVELESRFSSERRLADPRQILPERYAVLERRERK
jgi:O-methyltransferase involved in polyketide biosynthesis